MRLLFIGDIVGTPGIQAVRRLVPRLREREQLDLVVANAENAAAGSGLYPSNYNHLRNAGIDAFTMGDHIYKRVEILSLFEKNEPICKPANYPPSSPGKEIVLLPLPDGNTFGVVSLMGRTFMRPVDCPFQAIDRLLGSLASPPKYLLVDIHAEATADKYLMGHYLKGRVSAVLGTHTHVQTADEQIFPEGTAFICDVGMTGPYAGVLGRRVDRVLPAAINFVPLPFDVAKEDVRLAGVIVDLDRETGKAIAIRRVMEHDSGN